MSNQEDIDPIPYKKWTRLKRKTLPYRRIKWGWLNEWRVVRMNLSKIGRDFVYCQKKHPTKLGHLGRKHFRKKQADCMDIDITDRERQGSEVCWCTPYSNRHWKWGHVTEVMEERELEEQMVAVGMVMVKDLKVWAGLKGSSKPGAGKGEFLEPRQELISTGRSLDGADSCQVQSTLGTQWKQVQL